jgi:hypothetical protein
MSFITKLFKNSYNSIIINENITDENVYINHVINSNNNYTNEYYIIPNTFYNIITNKNKILDNITFNFLDRIRMFFNLPVYKTIEYKYDIDSIYLNIQDDIYENNTQNVIIKYCNFILNFVKNYEKDKTTVYIPEFNTKIKKILRIRYKFKKVKDEYHCLYKIFYNKNIEIINFNYSNFIIRNPESIYKKFKHSSIVSFKIKYSLYYKLI